MVLLVVCALENPQERALSDSFCEKLIEKVAVTLNRPLRFKINLKILIYVYNPFLLTSSLLSTSSNGSFLINRSDFYILALLVFLKGRDKVPGFFLTMTCSSLTILAGDLCLLSLEIPSSSILAFLCCDPR